MPLIPLPSVRPTGLRLPIAPTPTSVLSHPNPRPLPDPPISRSTCPAPASDDATPLLSRKAPSPDPSAAGPIRWWAVVGLRGAFPILC
uniref:Predicted protein n=1 Tax=Hordeum vulgare subsp. vulgare TaxID=112509 RepID=F2EDH3_HORVV|nr:predicted protein [Hordeum vulgare subsp. vulgare]